MTTFGLGIVQQAQHNTESHKRRLYCNDQKTFKSHPQTQDPYDENYAVHYQQIFQDLSKSFWQRCFIKLIHILGQIILLVNLKILRTYDVSEAGFVASSGETIQRSQLGHWKQLTSIPIQTSDFIC
jgi:hypothetical protein